MSQQKNIQKYQLQLIGVTALFIAAKLEVTLLIYVSVFSKQCTVQLSYFSWGKLPYKIDSREV